MKRQLTFTFDYGVTPEQACIMCHLSSKCSGCCVRCDKGCEDRYVHKKAEMKMGNVGKRGYTTSKNVCPSCGNSFRKSI